MITFKEIVTKYRELNKEDFSAFIKGEKTTKHGEFSSSLCDKLSEEDIINITKYSHSPFIFKKPVHN